jgi:PleD family two-component response regulator
MDDETRFIDSAAFIHAADGVLYEAKSSGRDCVVVYNNMQD